MDFSFIIVNWNAKRDILECLKSLVKESKGRNAEIIVVDNGSTDGSTKAIREFFPGVMLIENVKNLGFAMANNMGIRNSKGKYVCLVNSDVTVLEGSIGTMHDYMERHPKVGILGPQILNTDYTIQPSCKSFPTLWNSFCRTMALDSFFPKTRFFEGEFMTYWAHDTLRPVDIIVGCFWMARRTAIDEVGLLDERFFIYSEDKDWCKRFHEKGWEVIYIPDAKVIHYGGASSANEPIRFYLEMQKANLQYWEKHHDSISTVLFRLMLIVHNIFRLIGYNIVKIYSKESSKDIFEKIERSKAFLRWISHGTTIM